MALFPAAEDAAPPTEDATPPAADVIEAMMPPGDVPLAEALPPAADPVPEACALLAAGEETYGCE
jgi:hypothetical protein